MTAIDEMNDEEAADHPHVHFHVVPRMAGQPEDRRSIHVFRYLGVADEERVGEARMNELAAQIRRILLSL
jgi:diadenosine tetraphosphate (Ap4A) HIT family hydrolase